MTQMSTQIARILICVDICVICVPFRLYLYAFSR